MSTDLKEEFLVVGLHKDIDAAAFATENGMSVKQPISKRIVIATLEEGDTTRHPALSDPIFNDLPQLPALTPICNEKAAVFSAGDDRAIITTGLDSQEMAAVMRWRASRTGLKA
jgi:hypothetical protein